MKIVIPDPIDVHPEDVQKLKNLGAIFYDSMPEDTTALVERIKYAELITANYIDITPALIDQAPQLKYIVVPAVGYEWVAVDYARSKGRDAQLPNS